MKWKQHNRTECIVFGFLTRKSKSVIWSTMKNNINPFFIPFYSSIVYVVAHFFDVCFEFWSWCWNAEAKHKRNHHQHQHKNAMCVALSDIHLHTRIRTHRMRGSRMESISIDSRIICFTLHFRSAASCVYVCVTFW